MRPIHMLVTSLLVAAGTAAIAAPVLEGGRKFTTTLSGASEVNSAGVPNQGDPDGAGTARIIVNPGQARVCWEIETSNLDPVVGAHIHRAPAGQNGSIVVHLSAAQNAATSGCRDVTRALADEIRKSPRSFYVNVHTTVYRAGAIRGQLG
ncbi:MAG: CHRD domain-containing protein [Sphingomicrobium sp.]